MELENDAGPNSAIAQLVAALNAATAPGTYAYVDSGIVGTDAIKVGLLYQPSVVSPVGSFAVLDSSVDPRFIDTKSRPVLAQTFASVTDGGRFTVAVNHLKSKGSDCNDVGDPDTGDGAGQCNATRTLAAEALVDWLASDPTGAGDEDVLIIGDLNSYAKEDPIDVLLAEATQIGAAQIGPSAYSFVFDGESGYLDYGSPRLPSPGRSPESASGTSTPTSRSRWTTTPTSSRPAGRKPVRTDPVPSVRPRPGPGRAPGRRPAERRRRRALHGDRRTINHPVGHG